MISKKEQASIESQIIKCIAKAPQSLQSLIVQTQSTSAKTSWICQNLRGKGIIILNNEGLFCPSESTVSETYKSHNSQARVVKPSLET